MIKINFQRPPFWVLIVLIIGAFQSGCKPQESGQKTVSQNHPHLQPQYVGVAVCASCHEKETKLWQGSDHQLAMQEANGKTVLGDFNNASFTYNGIQSRFYKKEESYYVNTDGPDGKLHDYKIRYTFGVRPLQQYLIEFPGGRFQALSIVWDTRPKSYGGQRWFHLYPQEKIDYRDVLHWTGLYQNWNHMCAECHSTNLKKNYNEQKDRFNTTWSEISVSCEQCHGPGSNHVTWARNKSAESDKGLVVSLKRVREDFPIDAKTGNPVHLSQPLIQNPQVEACAQCHSRRTTIREPYIHGRPLADTHLPVLLEENLYYADGQIRDEVYEYGSFLQSKMFAQGVSCTNCHDPHSTRVVIPDSRICAQCHAPEKYQTVSHHYHKSDSTGADCRSCHMPIRNYMVVDQRRDHSFRIPRPDLSVKLGTPNACNQCHADKTAQWAARKFEQWYGKKEIHFAETIAGSRAYQNNFESNLVQLIENRSAPGIIRATALEELPKYISPRSLNMLSTASQDPDPLLRLACIQTMDALDPGIRLQLALPMLKDPLRSVRIRAVAVVAAIARTALSKEQQAEFDRVSKEYLEAQTINADRPDAQLNLGIFYANTGNYRDAESAYRKAIKLQPSMMAAYVNLADLYRIQGMDAKGESCLLEALRQERANPDVQHALGLLLVRQKRVNEALSHFAIAATQEPHYAYVYAIALNSTGKSKEAIAFLKSEIKKFPADRELLYGLISIARDNGDSGTVEAYSRILYRLYPDDRERSR